MVYRSFRDTLRNRWGRGSRSNPKTPSAILFGHVRASFIGEFSPGREIFDRVPEVASRNGRVRNQPRLEIWKLNSARFP
jgi:hypothetical protein